ncbi:MAG: hypothetical protein LZF86_140003 [Nitrospira sp.]|nr:MAG: hypothetical protein LZF86_140003 [Nitrospira sp.]
MQAVFRASFGLRSPGSSHVYGGVFGLCCLDSEVGGLFYLANIFVELTPATYLLLSELIAGAVASG